MCVIPVKCIPYLMVFYGVVGPFIDESIPTCLLIGALGAAWLYLKHAGKQSA